MTPSRLLIFVLTALFCSCNEVPTRWNNRLQASTLGCDIAWVDSLLLCGSSGCTPIAEPCRAPPTLTSQTDQEPTVDSLATWSAGFRLVAGTIGQNDDGSLQAKSLRRDTLLAYYLRNRKSNEPWPYFVLRNSPWPFDNWRQVPFPLDSTSATALLLDAMLATRFTDTLLPARFPWNSAHIDTLLAHRCAQTSRNRALYLPHSDRKLPKRFLDSLYYTYTHTDSMWQTPSGCPGLAPYAIRSHPTMASECVASSDSLDQEQARQCAIRQGGTLATYAQWRCALYAGDSLPWPLPRPLPANRSPAGVFGLLGKCRVWLADSTGPGSRRFLAILSDDSSWSNSHAPVALDQSFPLKNACLFVVHPPPASAAQTDYD